MQLNCRFGIETHGLLRFSVYTISNVSRCHAYLSVEAFGCQCGPRRKLNWSVILKKWLLHCADSEAETEILADVDWNNFGFGLRPTDVMFVMKCERDGQWEKGELRPFGNLELSPAAAVLNYGQVRLTDLKRYARVFVE